MYYKVHRALLGRFSSASNVYMGISRWKKVHVIKPGNAAADPILGGVAPVCAGRRMSGAVGQGAQNTRRCASLRRSWAGQRDRLSRGSRPGKKCYTAPGPRRLMALLLRARFYTYTSATEGTININGTKARCSLLLSLPCLEYFFSSFFFFFLLDFKETFKNYSFG